MRQLHRWTLENSLLGESINYRLISLYSNKYTNASFLYSSKYKNAFMFVTKYTLTNMSYQTITREDGVGNIIFQFF